MDVSNVPPGLCWIHIGDLHLQNAADQNYADLNAIVAQINAGFRGQVDFCYLPGDNANEGLAAQYGLVHAAVSRLNVPLHVIPGDHDYPGDLSAFYAGMKVLSLPNAIALHGFRCLFLDIVSAGRGGPDFRLSRAQLGWLEYQLLTARGRGERSALFMHAYPADLAEGREALMALIERHAVLTVDTGHTHYNELLNDGHTIFAATRSTGQIEEGDVGFSVMSVHAGHVSWRFKPLASGWPFAMITAPSATRLSTRETPRPAPGSEVVIAAKAWSPLGIDVCRYRIDDGPWRPLFRNTRQECDWVGYYPAPAGEYALALEVTDGAGNRDTERLEIGGVNDTRRGSRDGGDAHAVGAWLEKHIPGTRLGPNRNGHAW